MNSSMAHRVVSLGGKHMILAVQNNTPLDQNEWTAWLNDLVALGERVKWDPSVLIGSIAITDGGGPNARQRAEVTRAVTRAHPGVVAIAVTNNMLVRGILTALRWTNVNVKAFAPTEVDALFNFCGLSATAMGEFCDIVNDLSRQLPPPVKSAQTVANQMR